jgi:hypothetical protein
VLYTRTAIEPRGGGSLLPSIARTDVHPVSGDERARYAAERALDQILADSFPASGLPSFEECRRRRVRRLPGVPDVWRAQGESPLAASPTPARQRTRR